MNRFSHRPSRRPPRHPFRRLRAALVLAPALGLLALALGACGGAGVDESPDTAEPPAERTALVRTLEVTPERVVDRLELPADLAADRRAVLAAEVAGTVEAVTVDDGDRVSRGRVLVRVDTRALQQAVAEAEALDRQAQAQLSRARNLYERRSITQKDLLDAITNADVATARLASARLELDKSRLRAPWAGEVTARRVEVGDYVVPGQAMVELVDSRRVEVAAPVPASDVRHVEVGMPVTIRVSSLPGETFEARVVRLGAELDPRARTLALEAEVDNPEGRLKPGMLAHIALARRTLEDALVVPLDAVVDLEDRRVVYVVEDGRARRRTVELGPVVGDRVVVTTGLAPGDRVIVDGQRQVAQGQPVEESREPASRTLADPTAADRPADLAGLPDAGTGETGDPGEAGANDEGRTP